MRYSTLTFLSLAVPLAIQAAPARLYGRQDNSSSNAANILVLQFADVLEQFETAFYTQGIAKFQDSDFENAGFTSATLITQQLINFQKDESTHDSVLQATLQSLGASPISGCDFNLDPVLTDVNTMAATARVVEILGVSAYLGGATLVTDPVILDAAASIMTIEARHSTILNLLSGAGTGVPQAFDIPFTPSEVLAVASPFISGCNVGIPANPTLSLTNTGSVTVGTTLQFSSSAINGSTDGFSCQMMIGGAPFAIVLPFDQCVVPSGINGPVAIWITSDNNPLANNVIDRSTANQVAGPLLAFIDTNADILAQLARPNGPSASTADSITTQTITPEEASSIVAGASATSTASSASSTSESSSSLVPSTPNLTTGQSQDGSITVNGWTGLPPSCPDDSDGSTESSSTSSTSTASGLSSTPVLATGPSADGNIGVDGWTDLPSY